MEQLHNIEVYVGDTLNDRAQLCGVYDGPATTREVVQVVCSEPLNGTTVTVMKNTNGETESLVLCEVAVFGNPGICSSLYNENMPMQYTEIFKAVKSEFI